MREDDVETLPFGIRRAMVAERQNVEVVDNKIDNHINSCDSFRKFLIAIVTVALGMFGATLGVLYSGINDIDQRLSLIDGRQQVVLSRVGQVDESFASVRAEITSRITAVAAANSQREATFNERFAQILRELNELQKEFYAYRLKETRSSDFEPSPPGGPTRRNR